jgi:hypothetical protein
MGRWAPNNLYHLIFVTSMMLIIPLPHKTDLNAVLCSALVIAAAQAVILLRRHRLLTLHHRRLLEGLAAAPGGGVRSKAACGRSSPFKLATFEALTALLQVRR